MVYVIKVTKARQDTCKDTLPVFLTVQLLLKILICNLPHSKLSLDWSFSREQPS